MFFRYFLIITVMTTIFSHCTGSSSQPGITRSAFGKVGTQNATLYTLTNATGSMVRISDYGGIVQSIVVPDRKGHSGDVALGFDNIEGYQAHDKFIGALIGRYGNRIAHGRFVLDGTEYPLAKNNDSLHHLHGGTVGFNDKLWKAEAIPGDSVQQLKLYYTSPDMEEGYPGTLNVCVTYSWNDHHELGILYEAKTDKPTHCNLTNHLYFNLSGDHNQTVLNHLATFFSDTYTPVDATLIPTGELSPVAGTAFDFTSPKPIGKDIDQFGNQYGGGYDHNFVVQGSSGEMAQIARVKDPKSGRVLEAFTTEPGVQFYTANHMDGTFGGKGFLFPKFSGFCLETQHFPDSPNQPGFPSTRLDPGQTYKTRTLYRFSAE